MSRKSSTPSSLTFEESDQDDALMKQIFENVKDVHDEETPPEQTSKKKFRSSTRDSLKRPDDEIDLHGKTRDEAIKIVQKFVIDCYQKFSFSIDYHRKRPPFCRKNSRTEKGS